MEQLDVKKFASRWKPGDPGVTLLDVREPEEVEIAAIAGSVRIPMREIAGRIGELNREDEIVVHCHHGMRSLRVAAFLEQQGFARVWNLSGGIDAWSDQIDPKIPKY